MSLTPAQLAAGALGTSYALPSTQHGPTLASVLASMTPETRRYTKTIMFHALPRLPPGRPAVSIAAFRLLVCRGTCCQ
jgi:hypothetical protein